MKILQVLSLLLDYPTELLHDSKDDLLALVNSAGLSAVTEQALCDFVTERLDGDLMDWQADYDSLFERGRSLSLLLFEHVHGESRDRGQAMVNLQNQYRDAGLDIGQKELPDYLPLYLEFLSTQGDDNARYGLQEVAPVLALLTARLQKRQSNYAAVLFALLELSDTDIDLSDIQAQIASEEPDHTPKALDKVWEEEMVTFLGNEQQNGACSSSVSRPSEQQRKDQFLPLNTELLATDRVAADRLATDAGALAHPAHVVDKDALAAEIFAHAAANQKAAAQSATAKGV